MNYFEGAGRYVEAVGLITEDSRTLTYGAAADIADSFAAHLSSREFVFILADNSLESVIGYIGCLRARAPAALLAANIHPSFLARLLGVYRPHYLWLARDRASEVHNAVELFTFGSFVLLATGSEPLAVHEDLALLMTTSGSTGSPKFVRLSYGNLAANARSIAKYLEISGHDRAITSLPMHYVYGLSIINSHLEAGASVILTNASLMEKRFWDLLKHFAGTTLSGVPYTYDLLTRLRWDGMDLPALRVLTQAGGKLDPSLVHEFAACCRKRSMRFYVMYGAAEATARMAYLPPHLALEKPESIGVPIPGGELWIEDTAGSVITQPNVVGELYYQGPNVSLGYASCREDLALGDERRGVLQTGDLAKRDENGMFYIVGRKSRFVKIFGNRINLDELEQLIRSSGIDCACAGDDSRLRVYVTSESSQRDALSVLRTLIALHPAALQTIVIDQIPRNHAGKIAYAELT